MKLLYIENINVEDQNNITKLNIQKIYCYEYKQITKHVYQIKLLILDKHMWRANVCIPSYNSFNSSTSGCR